MGLGKTWETLGYLLAVSVIDCIGKGIPRLINIQKF
jgi:hypothetical protein